MTNNAEITNQIKDLLSSGKTNQSQLAKNVGYSSAVISQYLQGNYNGDVPKLEKVFEQYLQRQNEKNNAQNTKLTYCNTSIAEQITNAASLCHYNYKIGVCVGKSGIGKTTAIKAYAAKKGGVIYVDPDEKTRPRSILKQIERQLKLPDVKICIDDFIIDIVRSLKDSGRLIIVDEAENLDIHSFRVLRKIYDRCDESIGMLFVGTERLHKNLLTIKGEYEYIANRISRLTRLDRLTTKDVEMLVTQIFPNADSETIKHFESVSENNARILGHILETANILVNNGHELDRKVIISSHPGL
jgi:DNA transposition AAA+ family ATPase